MTKQLKIITLTVCILICLLAFMMVIYILPLVAMGLLTIALVVLCYQQAQYYIDKPGGD